MPQGVPAQIWAMSDSLSSMRETGVSPFATLRADLGSLRPPKPLRATPIAVPTPGSPAAEAAKLLARAPASPLRAPWASSAGPLAPPKPLPPARPFLRPAAPESPLSALSASAAVLPPVRAAGRGAASQPAPRGVSIWDDSWVPMGGGGQRAASESIFPGWLVSRPDFAGYLELSGVAERYAQLERREKLENLVRATSLPPGSRVPADLLLITQHLETQPFAIGFDRTRLERLANVVRLREYRAGEQVCEQGETGDEFFMVRFLWMSEKC